MITVGKVNMSVTINGWIPHDLVLTVDNNQYKMKFNIQSYDVDDILVVVPCLCEGEVAKNIYDQYRKMDAISIWGQPHHTYNPNRQQRALLFIKVLSYSIACNMTAATYDTVLTTEMQEVIDYAGKLAYERMAQKKNVPTEKEKEYWKNFYSNRNYK